LETLAGSEEGRLLGFYAVCGLLVIRHLGNKRLGTRSGAGGDVAGQVGFGVALEEVVFAADLADDGGHSVAVGGVHEVGGGEASVVVVGEVGKVFADEA
jgi:hypothetical protein